LLDEEPVTGQSIVKAFAVGILTAVVLALLNMYLKLFPFNRK
jgi:capsular polysaccharide biosynthesis protein